MTQPRRQTRIVGDLSKPISAQLRRRNGTTMEDVVLSGGDTIEFSMYNAAGTAKVAQTPATIDDASASGGAKVSYAPVAADVDTAGTFYGYFTRVDSGGKYETFPTDDETFEIVFNAR